jgi:PAS domain S-box-containing protein
VGGRVIQTGAGEVARAKRLKKASESGAAPGFVPPEGVPHPPHPSSQPITRNIPGAVSELEARCHRLEQMFENLPDGVCLMDPDHHALCINPAFESMFGYRAGEVLGQPVEALVVPPQREAEWKWVRECVGKGDRITIETQRRTKDGRLLEVSVSSAPIVEEGKVAAIQTVYRDNSGRKRAEALSSALYRMAQKSSAVQDLQQFFAAVHSIVDELMYARNFYIAVYDRDADLLTFPYFVDERDQAPAPRKPGQGLTEYLLRTGEPLLATPEVLREMEECGDVDRNSAKSLDWLGVPLKARNQTFGAMVVQTYAKSIRYGDQEKEILTLVSQQLASTIEIHKNEQALRRSEARYRSLVQSSVYGIYRASLDGKFLDVNPALITMLGYEWAEEVLALDPTKDVFANAEEYRRLLEEFQRAGRMDGIEVQWKKKDRHTVTVRISGRAVSSEGGAADVLEAIAEDVTERRALENQFRQAQKMEAVGRLAGGIAHDFNNLLMVISGYSEVLLGQLATDHPLYMKARAIQLASDRATTLTQQLLAFSRKQLLELKVVDVNTIVSDMERLLRPLIGENIELKTSLMQDAGHVRADAGQLEQVLMNLVVNSRDALPRGGKIRIATDNVSFDNVYRGEQTFIRPGRYVVLSVTDNGVGMDKETQMHIFEPFFTTKEMGKGTGLGLSTVYGIVKQVGGYVLVESEVGSGTTFKIYLPRVEGAEALGTTPAARAAAGGNETVLLVEDEESVRQLVRDTLLAKGYKVLEAESGDAGLAVAAKHAGTIDLLITDVVMPGMSGRELAQKLIAEQPKTRVLYLSGYTEEAIVSDGGMESGKAFLQKPFTLQNLSRKVREVLG